MMLNGFDKSPGGLSLMDATSKDVADVAAADGALGACADAAVDASRATKAKVHVERMLFTTGSPLRIFFMYDECD
jgi:hypothetical protein